MPLQVVKAEGEVDLQRYTTLVVKDFQNSVGDALPPGLLQQLPEAVMAHLNACYPLTFSKITRTATGSAEELVVEGTITEKRQDGLEESRPSGGLLNTVTLEDGQSGPEAVPLGKNFLIGTSFLAIDAVTGISAGSLVAPLFYDYGSVTIDVDTVGRQIADTIAENKGVTKKCVSQTDER